MGYNCGILYFSGNRQIRINHLHSYFTLRVSETLPFKGGLVALPSPFCEDELLLHTQKESVSRCDISRDRDVNTRNDALKILTSHTQDAPSASSSRQREPSSSSTKDTRSRKIRPRQKPSQNSLS